MGKSSKKRGRALAKAKKALIKVISLTEIYYNDTKMVSICDAAKEGLKNNH